VNLKKRKQKILELLEVGLRKKKPRKMKKKREKHKRIKKKQTKKKKKKNLSLLEEKDI